jgi:two-component system, sensor histidine kinase LadS
MRWLNLCLALVIGAGFTACTPSRPVVPSESERLYPLNDLEHFIDTTNRLSIQELSAPSSAQLFKRTNSYQNADYLPGASYWIRFSLPRPLAMDEFRLIEFYDQTIDSLEVYRVMKDGSMESFRMGDHHPFVQRTYRHKNFEIVVNPQTDAGTYYFKVRSHAFADIRMAYRTVDRFVYYALNEYFLYGTFYGMILIIALYNFLAYLAIREIKNIFYIFYILSVALYAMSLDGIGFQYLWPGFPQWNDRATGVALYLVIMWAIIFTRRFLSTQTQVPRLDRVLVYLMVVRTLMMVVAWFFMPQLFAFQNLDIIPLSLIFYTGIHVWRNGYRPARYFVVAYGLLFLGFFIKTLVYFDVLPFTILSHYSLHLSFVLEMLFLTAALGDRIRILKDNRDRALRRIIHQHEVNMQLQTKVNRELEQKVKERTLELDEKNVALEESNQKLVQQAKEINQINSLLDLDNWKLKNKVKEVLEERLHEKTMTYEEFRTLYPDTLSCYRFLEELKWKTGFQCRKCSNTKYFDGASKFARRCTRCGYHESITAYTIFQGIKIPLEKAFFIAYLAVAGKKGVTLDSISQQLELRLNTVWSFKKRVLERVEEFSERGDRLHASRWEEIILIAEENASRRIKEKSSARMKIQDE